MKKSIFISILILLGVHSALANERNYVEGDGTLNFLCAQDDKGSDSYNFFKLTFMYDSEKKGLDLFDPALESIFASGDGSIVYKMEVTQFPFYGAEIPATLQAVSGCEHAPLQMVLKENQKSTLYFECDGDGDAGFGNLEIDQNFNVKGTIYFPEGQSSLLYPFIEDTDIAVTCSAF